MSTARKTKGRPKGSKNHDVDQVDGELTRCARCGSTNRSKYFSKTERQIAGTDVHGKPYTHIVWRRTRCLDCGQHRVDVHRENRAARKK